MNGDYERRILKIYNEYENLETHERIDVKKAARAGQQSFVEGLEAVLDVHERTIVYIKDQLMPEEGGRDS